MPTAMEHVDEVLAHCPGLDSGKVRAMLQRIDPEYLERPDSQALAGDVAALLSLSADHPVVVRLSKGEGGLIHCTIAAFDHPFEFSSITGLMAGTGFSIESSDAHSLARVKSSAKPRMGRPQKTVLARRDPMTDGLILDHFRGRLVGPVTDFRQWSRTFEATVVEVMTLLDLEDESSIERAKRLVTERVTDWLRSREDVRPRTGALVPAETRIEHLPQATRLRLRAPDAPAFLYALSTALSLHGLQIVRTRIRTVEGSAIDEIDLVDPSGKPLSDPARVEELRLSVRLTQQCAYFLDESPDPFTALKRFEELSEKIVKMPQRAEWLELLADPLSMTDLAKVLGASDYLWEDFIKLKADGLLPVFRRRMEGQAVAAPARSLPRRLEEALAGARNFEEEQQRLNEFKDRELFLIDLEHVLSEDDPDVAFVVLSDRLVLLAENLVATSAGLVFQEMARLYGKPVDAKGKPVGYSIFGLGKLGGVALGYASDIELLFLYGADGRTKGGTRGAMPNDEFFAIFTRQTCDYIQAKREGIFEVDLRLRPYGKNGPLACSREKFASYYGPGGEAHAFERLALVRLRWIAGDPKLGFEIEQSRDQIVYDGPPPDLPAIWGITGKMRQQHLEGKKLNSKYSQGALTDLECTVQLLQVKHAKDAPQLRTPRLNEAIEALRRAGVLSPAEFDDLMAAYQFLRRLINAQRLLRGSAQDLFIPPAGSDDLRHLARRMHYFPDEAATDVGGTLLKDFERHTGAVRRFMKRRLG